MLPEPHGPGAPTEWVIPNLPGKKASVAIYVHLAKNFGGKLTSGAAYQVGVVVLRHALPAQSPLSRLIQLASWKLVLI